MILFILIAMLLVIPGPARGQDADAPLAPELNGLGTLHLKVTTSDPRAQRFFDQGLRLLYAFNHPESLRAFREAARLDPSSRHGVLGAGDGARTEPQRPADA